MRSRPSLNVINSGTLNTTPDPPEIHFMAPHKRWIMPAGKRNDPNVAICKSPLFTKLPRELREHVYSFVLPTEVSIQVRQPASGLQDCSFTFVQCDENERDVATGKCGPCKNRVLSEHGCQKIDTALLMVSQAVYTEGLHFLIKTNTIELRFSSLRVFTAAFPTFMPSLHSITIHHYLDDDKMDAMSLAFSRNAVKAMACLKHIKIYADMRRSSRIPKGIAFNTNGALNFFRPLARLPLESASVKLYCGLVLSPCVTEQTMRILEQAAQDMLLRDAVEPEEAQQDRPADQLAMIAAWNAEAKKSRSRAKLTYTPGQVMGRMFE